MNGMINKYLLAGDKFMPEMHLRQPRCTHSACGSSFTKTKKRIQKFKETGDSTDINQNEQDEACFQHKLFMEIFKIRQKNNLGSSITR